MDNVIVDFPSAFPYFSEKILKKYENKEDEISGIFSKMKPVEGAIDAFQQISLKYDTYILSTAPWNNPSAWSDKLKWVQKYLGKYAYKRLIISHNKNLNFGDYLIDDRKKNGADKFKGKHIHFRKDPFLNWNSCLLYTSPSPRDQA